MVQSNLVKTNTLNANVCLTRTIFPVFVGFRINVVLTSLLNMNTDIENFRLAQTVYTFKLEENSLYFEQLWHTLKKNSLSLQTKVDILQEVE